MFLIISIFELHVSNISVFARDVSNIGAIERYVSNIGLLHIITLTEHFVSINVYYIVLTYSLDSDFFWKP